MPGSAPAPPHDPEKGKVSTKDELKPTLWEQFYDLPWGVAETLVEYIIHSLLDRSTKQIRI